jgi:hypothetical protein
VQQHDIGAALVIGRVDLADRAIDDRWDAGRAPVARIDVQPDDRVAAALRDHRRLQFVGRGRFGIAEIRRAEQARGAARISFDQPLCRVEFKLSAQRRNLGKVGVGVAVVADLVAVVCHAAQQARVAERVLADDEEGCRDVLGFQHRQDLRGKFGIGPVVESKRDGLAVGSAGALHDIGAGKHAQLFVGDGPVRREAQRSPPADRFGIDAQDFAIALDIGSVCGFDALQPRLAMRSPRRPELPEARVFAAEAPQRDTFHAAEQRELVPVRRGVHHPDGVGVAVVRIGEAAVAAGGSKCGTAPLSCAASQASSIVSASAMPSCQS